MRIILFAGKGGVGKTSIAGATGVKSAAMGYKTLIMSLDIAHSLSDIFDLNKPLTDRNKGIPFQVDESLWIQELDIQEEIQKNWGEVHQYIASLFQTTGLDDILAEELAILPGMEEVSSLLYLNKYVQEDAFDVVILDCAPTGESLRFISIPTALDWYISKIFKIQRRVVSYVRPFAKRFSDIPLPEDDYFKALKELFVRLEGIDRILTDPAITTVRMVANPEKIVLKETQRAFLYFYLYRMCVDAVIMNRILPVSIKETYFDTWKDSQKQNLHLAEKYFNPIPIFPVMLCQTEPLGKQGLTKLSHDIYGERDPTQQFFKDWPYEFSQKDGKLCIKMKLPFVAKEEIEVHRVGDEMVVRIGGFKRHILLPRHLASCKHNTASMDKDYVYITFGGKENGKNI
ncbi:MAG: ArsA family ATPase [Thermodesulfobacteriota bacterium]